MASLLMYELNQGSVIPIAAENKTWVSISIIFSTIGITLSATALLLLILTAVLFIEWRKSYKNQLLVQFMLARFLYTFIRYFSDIQNALEISDVFNQRLITFDVLLVIYSEIALVSWMFVFTRQMYVSLVKVFERESVSIWKVSLCAWSIPGVLSLVLYMLYYVQQETDAIDFVFYIIIIKWPLLLVNAILLIFVLKSVIKSNNLTTNTYRSNIKIVIVMLVMIFMFCFQQMFIDVYKIVFFLIGDLGSLEPFLFIGNILAMYHCAFSITFWVLGNKNTRTLWKFQRKELRDKLATNIRFSA